MSRLTRDGTAEPVSRDQILRHARGQGNIIFPVQLTTSRIGNLTRLIHTLLYVMTIHTYIHTYMSVQTLRLKVSSIGCPYPLSEASHLHTPATGKLPSPRATGVPVTDHWYVKFPLQRFCFFFISLIADGPNHYHPACGHKGSSHLSPVHAFHFFIAMGVQHSYNSSTNG